MLDLKELRENYDQVRSLENWKLPEFRYASIEEFESSGSLDGGIHSIIASGLPIDLYMDIKPGYPIVFFFNGAKVRSDNLKLPFFAGLRVLPPGNVSRIYINDPSLYLEKNLSLGWYAGSKHLRLQEVLPRIIKHTITTASPSKVMFTGGSGGGFASLYYSRLFPNSLAVVWNPQTNILKFYSRHIHDYGKAAFSLKSLESTEALLPNLIQTDLCTLYASADQENYILYLQNYSDTFHVQCHLKPFLADIEHGPDGESEFKSGKMRNGLYVHGAHWGKGHVTPSREFLTSLFGNLLSYNYEWKELFANSNHLKKVIILSESYEAKACE
ncbi:hypothetical protein [Janthinobacterium rivuli]|uniref:hypothetical protein n=1 Tax=Janthinobacterium rivuli TaxID=2751478 RepID=UPI00383B5394